MDPARYKHFAGQEHIAITLALGFSLFVLFYHLGAAALFAIYLFARKFLDS
jgi:hypothetical protein